MRQTRLAQPIKQIDMDIIATITAGFQAIKEFFGFANKKIELNNTPEMRAACERQKEQDENNKDDEDIKNADLDDSRNRLS